MVRVVLDDKCALADLKAWAKAVLGFATQVEAFYAASAPKQTIPDEDTRQGWMAFWMEWTQLKGRIQAIVEDSA